MPYRILNTHFTCAVCATATNTRCRNCRAPHCEAHLAGPACPGCTAQLWRTQDRVRSASTALFAGIVTPAATLGAVAAFGAIGLLPLIAGLLLAVPMGALAGRIAERAGASRRLAPTSERAQLPSLAVSTNAPRRSSRRRSRAGYRRPGGLLLGGGIISNIGGQSIGR